MQSLCGLRTLANLKETNLQGNRENRSPSPVTETINAQKSGKNIVY